MTISVAPVRIMDLGWPPISRSGVEASLEPNEKLGAVPPLATAGVVACSVAIPVMGVYRVAVNVTSTAQLVPAVIATAVVLPPQLWLVLAASRGRALAAHRWALAAIAAVILVLVPIVGVTWLGALFPLSALVLVVMPRPYGFITFAAMVVLPIPIAYALDAPAWARYFSVGTLMYGLGVAVPVWLIAAARELHGARLALADEAVLLERLRIDQEVGQIVGTALASIAKQGEHAGRQALPDPAGCAERVRELVGSSRRTMAEVRRLVRGYQAVPLRSELRSALRLLEAAGVDTKLVLPNDLPAMLDNEQRRGLRTQVADLLRDDGVRGCVCTVTVHNGVGRVEFAVLERGAALLDVEAA
jgi:two-component system sensor histidine kinase DesK